MAWALSQLPNKDDMRMKLGTGPAKSGWHSLINSIHGRLWDRRAFSRAPQYVFQCGLATLALLIILLIDDAVLNAVVVAAVASLAFIVFVVPDSIAATPRKSHWRPSRCRANRGSVEPAPSFRFFRPYCGPK